jgi:hypothetical protein
MASREGRPLTRPKGHQGAILLTSEEEPLLTKEDPRVDRLHPMLITTINLFLRIRKFVSCLKKKKKNTERLDGASNVERKDT